MMDKWPSPIKQFSPKAVYIANCEGGRISDKDVVRGVFFFKDLSDKLARCGPVFKLAFKEANNTYNTLHSYAVARNLDMSYSYAIACDLTGTNDQ
jgi:hypothetical protein